MFVNVINHIIKIITFKVSESKLILMYIVTYYNKCAISLL
jgi:hypothetical protein